MPAIPVRVIHLLQHTAGFDDMHFNEMYNVVGSAGPAARGGAADQPGVARRPLAAGHAHVVFESRLCASPATSSRRSPARNTRIASPRRSSSPPACRRAAFVLTEGRRSDAREGLSRSHAAAGAVLADLFAARRQSAHLGRSSSADWCTLLLNWGETENDLVIDPEYLSNMEHPRTTARVGCGTAHRLRQRHRQLARWKAFRCSATAAASTASLVVRAIRRRATSATWSC